MKSEMKTKNYRWIPVSTVLVFALIISGSTLTAMDCEELRNLTIPGFSLEVTGAQAVQEAIATSSPSGPGYAGTIPSHCRVDGKLDKRIGSDSKPYSIGFAIALPDEWNGRFLFQGGAGVNGIINPPIGDQYSGDSPALVQGYAVVSTDSGHQGKSISDGSFYADQEATLNFLYKSIGKVTTVSKQIIREYYGKPADYSYFVGCSTGGREAMIVSQRYPGYFDGLVAGAPAMRTSYSMLGNRYVGVTLNQAAGKDESDKMIPTSGYSETDKKLIIDSFLATCDAGDGVADEMVFNIQGCDFDPMDLVCKDEKSELCLTRSQASSLKKAFAGPIDSRGNQVYPGFYFDTGIAAQGIQPGLLNATSDFMGIPFVESEMNVDEASITAANPIAAVGDSTWTNLGTFSLNGGKLIFFHGVSDPLFSAQDTQEYYQKMAEENGGLANVSNWSRLFLVPGMGHCSGGDRALDQFNMLEAIVNWVEKDIPPDRITATGRAFPKRSRPLCPFPKYAHYRRTGDSENAINFECRD